MFLDCCFLVVVVISSHQLKAKTALYVFVSFLICIICYFLLVYFSGLCLVIFSQYLCCYVFSGVKSSK